MLTRSAGSVPLEHHHADLLPAPYLHALARLLQVDAIDEATLIEGFQKVANRGTRRKRP